MSQAGSQAAQFYRDVATNRVVWTIRDAGGFPAPKTKDGSRAMPFWSSRSRVERIIAGVPAYANFEPFQLSWSDFKESWLPGMAKDGLLVGVNWSGGKALGYDLEPASVLAAIEAAIARLPN